VVRFALGGGCELALAADFRVSAVDAKWGLPEILLGLIPAGGGTQRLTQLVGPARAKRLILTGNIIDGTRALEIGLVDETVEASTVFDTAMDLARLLARRAPLAVRHAKAAVNHAASADPSGLRLESNSFAALFATEDAQHGLASFLQNGPAQAAFHGR
jgi:enoyl-CoA hydratase/carnithine racemase